MAGGGSGLLGGLVAGTLLTLGGWFCAFSIGKPLHERAAASTAWPVADGRITKSELSRSRDKGTTMYSADVAYEYAVDGRTLVGDAVWIGDGYRSSDAAARRIHAVSDNDTLLSEAAIAADLFVARALADGP
jgi:hypothetical protein